jgi:hypothetical protein
MADALAWLYIGSAGIKRYLEDGRRVVDEPFLHWSCKHAAHQIEEALMGVIQNHPNRLIGLLLRVITMPLGRMAAPPSDDETRRLAQLLVEDEETRLGLTADIYVPAEGEVGLPLLDAAWEAARAAELPRRMLREAQKAGRLPRKSEAEIVHLALEEGLLTEKEAKVLCRSHELREAVIQVDSFSPEEYLARCGA